MNITHVYKSSVGKKFIMAATGLLLFFFVFGHMVGNLQVFLGPEALNRYGAFLHSTGELLWVVRLALLFLVLAHIWSAVALTLENRAARPQPYEVYKPVVATYASRTMIWSGVIIAAFVVYHLLHYTAGVASINGTGQNFEDFVDRQGRHDVYRMVVVGFSNPYVALFYVVAMTLLFWHLSHGVSAMFQSLGWKSPTYAPLISQFAVVVSWLIYLGYISIPISILFFGLGHSYVESLAK